MFVESPSPLPPPCMAPEGVVGKWRAGVSGERLSSTLEPGDQKQVGGHSHVPGPTVDEGGQREVSTRRILGPIEL